MRFYCYLSSIPEEGIVTVLLIADHHPKKFIKKEIADNFRNSEYQVGNSMSPVVTD